MITLECPHCQSCFTAEDWNKSPHLGEDIPEDFELEEETKGWFRNFHGFKQYRQILEESQVLK